MNDSPKTIFEGSPNLAMSMLFQNRNALVLIANIIGKHALKYGCYKKNINLNENECFFSVRRIRTKPSMTLSQIKTAFKNLEYYGFIKIIEMNEDEKQAGVKKIQIIANPFDYETVKMAKEEYAGGYPPFD